MARPQLQRAEANNWWPAGSLSGDLPKPLQAYPPKGCLIRVLPPDPLIISLYEIMQVYGLPLQRCDSREIGDGIMSAIDFTSMCEKSKTPAALASGQHVWQVSCPTKNGNRAR